MKITLLAVFLCLPLLAMSQNYARVKFQVDETQFLQLLGAGLALDHIYRNGDEIIAELDGHELSGLSAQGIPYEIQIPDLESFYAHRLKESLARIQKDPVAYRKSLEDTYGNQLVTGFKLGSMGGFFTS